MSHALYAVEVEGVVVLARARVLVPTADEIVDGLAPDVETLTVDGIRADLVQRSDQWWSDLWHALVEAEYERCSLRAEQYAREEAQG